MSRKKIIYAIYDNDTFIDVGTAKELVDKGHYKTIKSLMSCISHRKGIKNPHKEVIKVDYEEM